MLFIILIILLRNSLILADNLNLRTFYNRILRFALLEKEIILVDFWSQSIHFSV